MCVSVCVMRAVTVLDTSGANGAGGTYTWTSTYDLTSAHLRQAVDGLQVCIGRCRGKWSSAVGTVTEGLHRVAFGLYFLGCLSAGVQLGVRAVSHSSAQPWVQLPLRYHGLLGAVNRNYSGWPDNLPGYGILCNANGDGIVGGVFRPESRCVPHLIRWSRRALHWITARAVI